MSAGQFLLAVGLWVASVVIVVAFIRGAKLGEGRK